MSSPQRERELGDRWARGHTHHFIMKLPASSTAGIPDWLRVGAPYGAQLIEAKVALEGQPNAYEPEQLSGAQHFTLAAISRRWRPAAQLLLLAEDGYVEMNYTRRRLTWAAFNRRKRRYV